MNQEIVKIIRERGLLLEKNIFDLLNSFNDTTAAISFLENLERASGQKMITSSVISNNFHFVKEVVKDLPGEMKEMVERTFVKMGVQVEIKKETEIKDKKEQEYQIFYSDTKANKKVELSDFVGHFRSRYQQIQRILMQRTDVQNLISINKIGSSREKFNIIGMLSEKRVSANKNLILKFEDLTGEIKALVKFGSEAYTKAAELQMDDIVAIKATGSKDMLFVYDVIFPDAFKEKVRFEEDVWIALTSDIHVGSKKHLGNNFEKFLNWLNNDKEIAPKIKYLFIVGDNVDGVGVFPSQESLLELKSLKDQYSKLAEYLVKVPKNITMFMCPGQHDSVRVAEPQPVIDNYYGAPLYDIENLILVSNPTMIKLKESEKEFKVLMYHGASIHSFINEIEELRVLKAHKCPAKAVKHMLKRRHLAPSHGVSASIVYVPNNSKDPLVISEVPDILCTGEVHRLDIENYNGVVIITGSCWQAQTEFEEKVGNVPDPCKVPLFNLKTREMKILDFTDENE